MGFETQIQQLTIPMYYSGHVNIYFIEGTEGYYLIDAGLATDEAVKLINQWAPRPITGVLLTHAHQDHLGLAGAIARTDGCPVYLFSEEYQRLQDANQQSEKIKQLFAEGGLPAELRYEAIESYEMTRRSNADKLTGAKIVELSTEDKFSTNLGDLDVIHTPGHTMGHCCFYLAEQELMFSGDHILEGVSPNPILEIGEDGKRRLGLLEYHKSLDKIKSLPVKRFYPGHGQPFEKLDNILEQYYMHHLKREQKILGYLTQEPQTPFQICDRIYPGVRYLHLFLTLSRVWGYLDLLNLEGKVFSETKGNTTFYGLS